CFVRNSNFYSHNRSITIKLDNLAIMGVSNSKQTHYAYFSKYKAGVNQQSRILFFQKFLGPA
ncbi:MAG TPA: hypothetical protein VN038_11225, partial [Dyadobacter sp.]|nr:hypothetical protein [Dyadobacter sp.]